MPDSTLVILLPKVKVIFTVDWLPVGSLPGRGMIDAYPLEREDSIRKVLAMDWEADPRPSRRRWAARHEKGGTGRARVFTSSVR